MHLSWANLLLKISMYCRNVLSSFFDVKKQRSIMNLEKCYQYSANIEIPLDLKVYFSLVTCEINNLISLRSTNQITEIFAPWWLVYNIHCNKQGIHKHMLLFSTLTHNQFILKKELKLSKLLIHVYSNLSQILHFFDFY